MRQMDNPSRALYTLLNVICLLTALVGAAMLISFAVLVFREGPIWTLLTSGLSVLVVALLMRVLWDIWRRLARVERMLAERASGEE